MSEPFQAGDDYVVIFKGKWYKFFSYDDAWEFYREQKEN